MEQNAIWGEEWQWPVVGQVADSILSQAEECLTEEKTEEEIRMEKYIVENILESEESQHGNSSGSSSDTFYDFRAPNIPSSPISSTTTLTQPRMVFSFPPPTTYSVWPTSNYNSTNNRATTTYYGSTYNPSRMSVFSDQTPTYQERSRPARHFSLPVSNSQPIPTMSRSTTTTTYPPNIT